MKTSDLKEICAVFTNIIKENKLHPVTDFVEMYSKDGVAHLGATDNKTSIVATIPNDNDFENVTISLHTLHKLVKLTTKDTITLTHEGNYVKFKGNGTYKIQIQVDEMGNDVYLPLEMPELGESTIYTGDDFKYASARNKIGLFTENNHEEFKLYYNDNGNLTTSDSIVVAHTHGVHIPNGDLQPFIIEQLASLKGEFQLSVVDGGYRVSYGKYEIYIINKLYDTFPIDIVQPFLDTTTWSEMFPAKFTVDKNEFVASVKRQDIFRSIYDIPSTILCVDGGITLKNTLQTVEEALPIIEGNSAVTLTTEVETGILLECLKPMGDKIELYIGSQAICIKDSEGFYIISAIEGDV